ncbi:MAG: hypothetical protein JO250_11080 [Armatimonadetes bacterium]|nr:hypothetical protein [Armatimonadota bacterium]
MRNTNSRPADPKQALERTSFQTGAAWDPMLQLRSDVAMCYGVGPDIGARIAGWKAQGYRVHVMTGVSWGQYQDYLYGRFDGVNHVDEAQMDRNGKVISHGGDVYYMSPGENYGKFLSLGVGRALDAGAEAIHLEEPEFWVRAGWSQGFRREWKAFYHEDWVPPDSSPEAQYRASQLKYFLYRRALTQIFEFVKGYNKAHGTDARCYVPTHSLINYAQWGIVSPESSLQKVGADGYIAQVWTGTARTPNVYEGHERQRTFETAYLEYGAMMNLVRAGGGTVWFLNDPIEDNPNHSWRDYRTNWESTLTASLLWPQVWRYEVMPWPERIFHGTYPTKDSTERRPGEAVAKEPIPPDYATELMTVINALNDMNQSSVTWDCGTRGVGVVVSDTMMFQRGGPSPSDPHLGSFYGLAMPLVKRGLPVEPVQLENAARPGALKPYKVLLMTYEGMKPMTAEDSAAIAAWVKAGGVLVFVDDDSDPYNHVRAWWNAAPNGDATPRQVLFAQMGLVKETAAGAHKVGKGTLLYDASSPAALTYQADGADHVRDLVRRACRAARLPYRETNFLALRRGPYVVAAGLDESLPDAPHQLTGHFVDLFDAGLPILDTVTLAPGRRYLLLDLDRIHSPSPAVLAAACKTLGARRLPQGGFRFYAEGPDATQASVRLRLAAPPKTVLLDDQALPAASQVWDTATRTLLLRFPNAAGRWITVRP